MHQRARAHFDASVMDARFGIMRYVNIYEDRLHALALHAVISGRQIEGVLQRKENVGVPRPGIASILVVGDHPLAEELRGSALLKDCRQLAFGEQRLRDGNRDVPYRRFALDRNLESDKLVSRSRKLDA